MPSNVSGGWARPLRRLSILVDVQDQATAKLMALKATSDKAAGGMQGAAAGAGALKAGLAATAVAAGASLIAMKRLTRIGAQLDTTFAKVAETTSATSDEMERIRARTSEIGAEMPVALTEVANAFEQFAYAGFTAEESIEASQAAVELAVAGQISMDKAVATTTKTLNAFNMNAEESDTITNALSSTYANSATTIQELGSAMSYASAQMSQMGFTATEVTGAFGVMADAGMEGTMAGTALNQAFSQMITGGGNVEQALGAVGMTLDDLTDEEGNMRPMVEIVQEFKERLDEAGISGQGLSVWLEDVAGRRGARALGPLISGAEDFATKIRDQALAATKDLLKEIEDVEQARMEIMANVDDVEEAQQRMEGMSDEAIIEWSHEFDEDIPEEPTEFVNWARAMVEQGEIADEALEERLMGMMDMTRDQAAALAEIIRDESLSEEELRVDFEEAVTGEELAGAQAETVGGKLMYLKGSLQAVANEIYTGFKPALQGILNILIVIVDVLNENAWALRILGKVMMAVTVVATSYATKYAALLALYYATTPAVQSLVAALGAKIAVHTTSAAVAYSEAKIMWNMGQRYKAVSKIIHGALIPSLKAKAAAMAAMNPYLLAATVLVAALGAAYAAYKTDFMGFASVVNDIAAEFSFLNDVYADFMDAFKNEDFSGMVDAWYRGVTGIVDVITEHVSNAIDSLLSLNWLDTGVAMVQSVADGVVKSGPKIIKALVAVVALAALALIAGAAGLVAVVGLLGVKLIDWIFSGIEEAGDRIAVGLAKVLVGAVQSLVRFRNAFKKKGMALIDAFVEGVKAAPANLYGAVKSKLGPVGKLLPDSDADEGPLSGLSTAGAAIPKTMAGGAESEGGALQSALDTIFGEALGGDLGDVGEYLKEEFLETLEGVSDWLETIGEDAEDVLEIFEDVKGFFQRQFARAIDIVRGAITDLGNALSPVVGFFQSLVDKAQDLIDKIPGLEQVAGVFGGAVDTAAGLGKGTIETGEKVAEGAKGVLQDALGFIGGGNQEDEIEAGVSRREAAERFLDETNFNEAVERSAETRGVDPDNIDRFKEGLREWVIDEMVDKGRIPNTGEAGSASKGFDKWHADSYDQSDARSMAAEWWHEAEDWVEENDPSKLERHHTGYEGPDDTGEHISGGHRIYIDDPGWNPPEGPIGEEEDPKGGLEMEIEVEDGAKKTKDGLEMEVDVEKSEQEAEEDGHDQVFAEKVAEQFVEDQANLREDSALPETETGDDIKTWIENEVLRRLEEGDYPGDEIVHGLSKTAADKFGISEENARAALENGIEAAEGLVSGVTSSAPTGPVLPIGQTSMIADAGEQMYGATDCLKKLCSAINQLPGVGGGGMAPPQAGGNVQLLGSPSPTGGSTKLGKDRLQYVDDRRVVVEQSPTIEISGGSLDQQRDWSEHIARAMEQARYNALDDFIDFLTLPGPEAMDRSPGEPSEPGEDGEPVDSPSLPPNWDQMDEEEQQDWVDENTGEDIEDPEDAEEELPDDGSDDGSGDGSDDGTDEETADA